MQLNELRDNLGASRPRKRVGRGMASGTGKTSGHGQKGQKARTGVAIKGFEGGQMPLQRRLPKRGFVHMKDPRNVLNIQDLQMAADRKRIDVSKPLTSEVLHTAGLIKNPEWPLRIIGNGDLKVKLDITAHHVSKGARGSIEKAGGKVTEPKPQEKKKA